jgi:hypothetical protein
MLVATAVSVLMWRGGLWTAGDAKLLIAFASLLPPQLLQRASGWSVSLDMLINIFIPALALVILLSAMRFVRFRPRRVVLRDLASEFTDMRRIGLMAVQLFGLLWAVQLILSFVGRTTFAVQLAITVVLASVLYRKRMFIISLLFGLTRFLFDSYVYTAAFWLQFASVLLVFLLLQSARRGVIGNFLSSAFLREVPVGALRPGMLAQIKGKEVVLARRDIARMRRSGTKQVRVEGTLPFAPFIFIGALLTLTLDGNVLIVFFNL